MPSPIKLIGVTLLLLAGAHATPWQNIAASIGVAPSRILVITPGQSGPTDALARTEAGEYLILEGESPLATMIGFRAGIRKMTIHSIVDARAPMLSIIWQRAEEVQRFDIPKEATVFATERW